MSGLGKRKIGAENNTGLYQVQPGLSTILTVDAIDRWLISLLAHNPPHVWLLSGPLGAGKTTVVQRLADRLGIQSDVTSPTFALQKIYPLRGQAWKQLVHIDAYRIKTPAETAALELEALATDPSALLVVEWPEMLPGILWGPHLMITLALVEGGRARKIVVARSGEGLRRS